MQNVFPEIKELLYKKEKELSPYAKKSFETKGREHGEIPCPYRTEFQRDRDRILHSKAFRRLKRKTQVFFAPKNDHLRTRLTHTLEVSQIARTISRILNLNEDLTEAIALGHDIGHTPFGHSGEAALNSVVNGGFKHNVHSVRVAQVIEGLNLTHETIDGILNHTGDNLPETLEGQIVKMADRIAYISHDIEDAIREEVMVYNDIPKEYRDYFGENKSQMLSKIISNIYQNSKNKNLVSMGDICVKNLNNLRDWMFKNVYFNDKTKDEEDHVKNVVISLFNYYKNTMPEAQTIDYVAGMSDEFAIEEYNKIIK